MDDREKKIRFAVIGAGYIGRRHLETIAQHPEAQAVGVVEIDAANRNRAAEQFGVPVFETLAQLFANVPAIDVLNVCTPNGLHLGHATEGLQAGAHVLVEKPLGLSAAACRSLIDLGETKNKNIFCVMQNRFSPQAQWLKQTVEAGRLGKILLAQINCFWNRDERYYQPNGWKGTQALDGGVVYTQFSHFIDILYWVLGKIEIKNATMENFTHQSNTELADTGVAQFQLKDGGMGVFSFSTSVWDKNQESSLTLVGEKGSLKIGGQYMNALEYCHIQGVEPPQLPPAQPPNDYGGYQGSASNHFAVIQNVIDVLKKRAPIATPAQEGAAVVEIIEKMYQLAAF